MNKDEFGELKLWFGEQSIKPTDDNIFPLQQGLIQKLGEWGIFFIGVKPQGDGSLEFLLEKSGIQIHYPMVGWWSNRNRTNKIKEMITSEGVVVIVFSIAYIVCTLLYIKEMNDNFPPQ